MSKIIGDNYSYGGKQPNFVRDQFLTKALMDAFDKDFLDDGHQSFCVGDRKHYYWDDQLKKWVDPFANHESRISDLETTVGNMTDEGGGGSGGIDVEWGEASNINDYTATGSYRISGIRLSNSDNLPLNNAGENASIAARLIVTESPEGTTTYRSIIGQTLFLSNAEGHETKVYTRSAIKTSEDGGVSYKVTWENWNVCQGMEEVGQTTSYDTYTDNGMYSGVNTSSLETFVVITINDYALATQAGSPRHVAQLKYSVTVSGDVNIEKRVGTGNETIEWSQWTSIASTTSGVMESIGHSTLMDKRNGGSLVPGKFYRINDYETFTSQQETTTIGIPFNVVVMATSTTTLSEEAFALPSASHPNYFTAKEISAWKLLYCLDNDTTRFQWAHMSGKGVIYYMRDGHNNEAWYDFKSIKFLRSDYAEGLWNIFGFTEPQYFYTFSRVEEGRIIDDSLCTGTYPCTDNHLGHSTGTSSNPVPCLNNTIFIGNGTFNNVIGDGHANNTFGKGTYNNVIEHSFKGNALAESFQNNKIGYAFQNNVAKSSFYDNNVDQKCQQNTFAGRFQGCTLKSGVSGNTFGYTLCCEFGAYFTENKFALNSDGLGIRYCVFGGDNHKTTNYPSAMKNIKIDACTFSDSVTLSNTLADVIVNDGGEEIAVYKNPSGGVETYRKSVIDGGGAAS